ncbi:hypothetical protein DS2_10087 [Catenovulum agarivorans DS-2]|uniref:DUF2788 domain-containing protein n=1 Tax=Catenovulum agarivorans DS-2 TaxID=1328313 RepID=W7QPZ7_9ALTE|nr:DUF2788 domain-containing protein [Catenovulum agarivorans]EWH09968.1 hypothetical protein DS2_10087 [Catenovulum agarivorans DS-2]
MTFEQFETLSFYLGISALFLLIGLAIKDVLKTGDVPLFGKIMVWLVLFLGCAGFLVKGLIQVFF